MPAVLKIDNSSSRMAETVIDTAGRDGVEILTLNSMQSTTGADADSGVTYISVMEENFDVIKAALG